MKFTIHIPLVLVTLLPAQRYAFAAQTENTNIEDIKHEIEKECLKPTENPEDPYSIILGDLRRILRLVGTTQKATGILLEKITTKGGCIDFYHKTMLITQIRSVLNNFGIAERAISTMQRTANGTKSDQDRKSMSALLTLRASLFRIIAKLDSLLGELIDFTHQLSVSGITAEASDRVRRLLDRLNALQNETDESSALLVNSAAPGSWIPEVFATLQKSQGHIQKSINYAISSMQSLVLQYKIPLLDDGNTFENHPSSDEAGSAGNHGQSTHYRSLVGAGASDMSKCPHKSTSCTAIVHSGNNLSQCLLEVERCIILNKYRDIEVCYEVFRRCLRIFKRISIFEETEFGELSCAGRIVNENVNKVIKINNMLRLDESESDLVGYIERSNPRLADGFRGKGEHRRRHHHHHSSDSSKSATMQYLDGDVKLQRSPSTRNHSSHRRRHEFGHRGRRPKSVSDGTVTAELSDEEGNLNQIANSPIRGIADQNANGNNTMEPTDIATIEKKDQEKDKQKSPKKGLMKSRGTPGDRNRRPHNRHRRKKRREGDKTLTEATLETVTETYTEDATLPGITGKLDAENKKTQAVPTINEGKNAVLSEGKAGNKKVSAIAKKGEPEEHKVTTEKTEQQSQPQPAKEETMTVKVKEPSTPNHPKKTPRGHPKKAPSPNDKKLTNKPKAVIPKGALRPSQFKKKAKPAFPANHHAKHPTAKPPTAKPPTAKPPTANPQPHGKKPVTAPKPQANKPTVTPKPQANKPTVTPKPQANKPTVTPKPQANKPTVTPKPQANKPTVTPKLQQKKPPVAPKQQVKKPPVAPKQQVKKPPVAPKQQVKKPPVAPKQQVKKPPVAPKQQVKKPPVAPKQQVKKPPVAPKPQAKTPPVAPKPQAQTPATTPKPHEKKMPVTPQPQGNKPSAAPTLHEQKRGAGKQPKK